MTSLWGLTLHATEIDSFSFRHLVQDGVPSNRFVLNEMVSNRMKVAMDKTNASASSFFSGNKTCNSTKLMGELKTILSGRTWYFGFVRESRHEGIYNPIETDFDQGFTIYSKHPLRSFHYSYADSIFASLNTWDTWTNRIRTGAIIAYDHLVIGGDKFAHFLSTGYMYYDLVKNYSKSYQDILAFGEQTEFGIYGMGLTGIYSYADLAANEAGFHFWNNLIEGENPYIVCKDNKWQFNKKHVFDWGEYVTPAWDEGINCNKLSSPQLEKEYLLYELTSNVCPLKWDYCEEMLSHYKDKEVAKRLINPICWDPAEKDRYQELFRSELFN